jgi:hypothetical protein
VSTLAEKRQAAREKAEKARAEAKQKAVAAKRDAEEARRLAKNKPSTVHKAPEPTGDPEVDTNAELKALHAAFRKGAQNEEKRFLSATDSEFWCCICFQTREQKEAFLAALNLLQFGDKYLDGQLVAEQMGVSLPQSDAIFTAAGRVDPKWLEFVEE